MAAKRKAFDIETKYNALSDIQKGDKSRQEIASKYGVSVYTLNGWHCTRDAITEAFEKQEFGPKRKKIRNSPLKTWRLPWSFFKCDINCNIVCCI